MATAAELREATIQMHCDSGGCDSVRGGPPGSHDSVGCHLAGMLDDLMAAVRAEALEEAMEKCEERRAAALKEAEVAQRRRYWKSQEWAQERAGGAAECLAAICALVSK